jgi:hypothetical protein
MEFPSFCVGCGWEERSEHPLVGCGKPDFNSGAAFPDGRTGGVTALFSAALFYELHEKKESRPAGGEPFFVAISVAEEKLSQ